MPMKKLLFLSTMCAFASVSAVQAGESSDKAKPSCSDSAKSSCCATKATAKKADVSVRGATLLVRR
jgi:hypothetical protein